MLVEQLDQLGEVRQRAGQAVDLVDHDDVDLAGLDLGEKLLQGRAVERGTGEGAIIIAAGNQAPALVRLTLYIRLAGLPLRVQGVEFEIEIMLGRFPGVDRAPEQLLGGLIHCSPHVGNPSSRWLGRRIDCAWAASPLAAEAL